MNNVLCQSLRLFGGQVSAAMDLRAKPRVYSDRVVVEDRPLVIAFKPVEDEERFVQDDEDGLVLKRGWKHARCQVMLRIPLEEWARLNVDTKREPDAFFMRHEECLKVLVTPGAYPAPFEGYHLALQMLAPRDPYVGHIITVDGKWRDSRWLLCKE